MSNAEKPELKRANDNPWYCLATLYGEQAAEPSPREWNKELAARNRVAWNRWMSEALSDEQRASLAGHGFPESELVP